LLDPKTKKNFLTFVMQLLANCNIIGRIFGVLKACFNILDIPPQYAISIQICIALALCALHNFILQHDPEDMGEDEDDDDEVEEAEAGVKYEDEENPDQFGDLGLGAISCKV
jgi:hypothetical protein